MSQLDSNVRQPIEQATDLMSLILLFNTDRLLRSAPQAFERESIAATAMTAAGAMTLLMTAPYRRHGLFYRPIPSLPPRPFTVRL